MEGTEAVNTNQNNGSPFEDAADQSGQDSTDSLRSQPVSSRDMADGVSAEADQHPMPQQMPAAAIPPHRSATDDSSAGAGYARHSVEGVSSIQKLVHAMETTGPGYVDEVIEMEPRDRGAIEFRVTCPGSPVRRLRLTGNRYTFGSAEGCSIRLSDDTLRPMHAVLLRDASRIIVRAYSAPIQVNASRTTEASLQVGDVLRLGQYQFELLSVTPVVMKSGSGAFSGSPAATNAGDDGRDPSTPESFARSTKAGTESRRSRFSGVGSEDSAAGGPTAEDMLWRDRLRREVDQWRERQIECDRREGRMDERESELRNRETELWSRAENLYRRESRLQSQETSNFQLYDEFSQRQQELLAIREENHLREESFHAREVEIREQELQYRSQLEEATRRLHQSQQQAESAAESVAQMREQFESLNTQIEQLSKQHLEIEVREQNQRVEHERLRTGLEQARDQAVQNHAASENRRLAAEEQAAKLEEQITQLRAAHGSTESEQLTQLSDSEAAAESLRQQVEELQQMVSSARNEAEVLRADYEQACSSVRQLEDIVSESEGRGDENREQWIAETSELRSAVEKLSSEMDQANSELNQLRDANDDLTRRLTEVKQERDQSRLDVESSPSQEEVEALRHQLESANQQIGTMQLDHEQTLVRLEAAEQQNEQQQPADDPNAHQADAVWEEVGNVESDGVEADSVQQTAEQERGNQAVDVSELDDEVEPRHVDTSGSGISKSGEYKSGNEDSGLHDADSLEMHLENEMRVDGELPDGDQMVGGSLASKLIQDLEAEDGFPSSPTADHQRTLDAFSNLTYSGDEEDGLSATGYMQPETEDWSTDAEASDQELNRDAETGDQPNSVVIDNAVGFYETDGEVDEFKHDHAPYQSMHQDMATENEAAVADDHEAVGDEWGDAQSASDESAADSEGSQFTDSEDEDDTIEAYMNRLLQHVRGDAEDTNSENDVPDDAAAMHEEDLEPFDPNAPLVPRSLAPERDTDLNAMRELANTSARVAIKRSARLQARNIQLKGAICLAYALGAIACGAVCFMFLNGILVYVASAMTGLVAIIYVREAMQLFQEASYQYSAATNVLQDEGKIASGSEEYADE
jgi:predicted  nucleic acid-binding Zn-ribbon protein